MVHKKLFHTHKNPAGNNPLFIVVEGMTCAECEKAKSDDSPVKPARTRVQTPKRDLAADDPKQARKRKLRPLS